MSDLYGAPKVLLGLSWKYVVDVWSIGVIASINIHSVITCLNQVQITRHLSSWREEPIQPHWSCWQPVCSSVGTGPVRWVSGSPITGNDSQKPTLRTILTNRVSIALSWTYGKLSLPKSLYRGLGARAPFEDLSQQYHPERKKTGFSGLYARSFLTRDPEVRANSYELIQDEWTMKPPSEENMASLGN